MYVVIAGGGAVGGSLAGMLVANRHDVVVIEREQRLCETIATRGGALTLHGTATNIEILEQAGIEKADVAVAALPIDGDNLAFALLARHFKVPRIIARMRNARYEEAYKLAGVIRTINVADLFVRQLVLEIEQPKLQHVAGFGRGKGVIVAVTIPENAAVDGSTVQQIAADADFLDDCNIAGIFRESTEEFIIPRGHIVVRAGDRMFLAANSSGVRYAARVLQKTK